MVRKGNFPYFGQFGYENIPYGDKHVPNALNIGDPRRRGYLGQACNGYEHALDPPVCVKDVAYWLNYEIERERELILEGGGAKSDEEKALLAFCEESACINASIEESTLGARLPSGWSSHLDDSRLYPQDKWIQKALADGDILISSCGGNDVALGPSLCTVVNIISALCCASATGNT